MLNPSTADAQTDDPTIRKVKGFTKRWGFFGFHVVNLYPLRSPDPRALKRNPIPESVHDENEGWIRGALDRGFGQVICAWGSNGGMPEAMYVVSTAKELGVQLSCLGRCKNSMPRHPLMLAYDTPLEPYA